MLHGKRRENRSENVRDKGKEQKKRTKKPAAEKLPVSDIL